MFNQCPICYSETTLVYEMNGQNVCPSCFTIEEFGGEGSGNFGHEGRPGEIGGSSGEGGGGGSGEGGKSRGHIENLDESEVINSIKNELKVSDKEAVDYYNVVNTYTSSYLHAADIRDAQRNPTKFNKELVRKAELLDTYVKKAPMYKGKIYRGIMSFSDDSNKRLNTIKNLKLGDIVDMKGTSSWTSFDVEAKQRGVGGIVFMSENVKNSTSIKHLSKFKDENEVLVSKDSKFKIKNIEIKSEKMNPRTNKGRLFDTYYIEVEEV